jgi:hypothetical protein
MYQVSKVHTLSSQGGRVEKEETRRQTSHFFS